MPKRFYPTSFHSPKPVRSRVWWIIALSGAGLLAVILFVARLSRESAPSMLPIERTRIATTQGSPDKQLDSVMANVELALTDTARPHLASPDTIAHTEPEPDSARAVADNAVEATSKPAPLPTVTLFNGCGVKGIGSRAQAALERMGFTVVDVRNARSYDYKFSEVLDRIESREAGRVLADSLGIKHRSVAWDTTRSDMGADVSLIIGKDYRKLRWKINS